MSTSKFTPARIDGRYRGLLPRVTLVPRTWWRLLWVLALLAGLIGSSQAQTAQAADVSPEVASFTVHDMDWTDSARERPVPVRLYWPQQSAAQGTVPLVVVSHGIGGSRRGYSYLGQYFARHGMASLHLQHVGSDRALWSGNPLSLIGRLRDAAQESEAANRARDLSFALGQLLDQTEFGMRIDRQRIAAAGHSYGANTVMLAIGAQVSREGMPLPLRDLRLKAAVLLSAPPFYGEGSMVDILRGISLPTLHVTATGDVIRIPGYFSPASDRVAVFDAMGGSSKALAVFEGGSHNIFSDRQGSGGAALNAKVKAATQTLAMAFLQSVFQSDDRALLRWPEQNKDLLSQWIRPPSGP